MGSNGCLVFDSEKFKCLTEGLQLAKCMVRGETSAEAPVPKLLDHAVVAEAYSCSCCGVRFDDTASQRAHFKLDWHRFNLKRQLVGISSILEEEFDSLADKDEVGSISGSESESDSDEKILPSSGGSTGFSSVHNAKVYFNNASGQLISLYCCLLSPSKESVCSGPQLVKQALSIKADDSWAIIMLGGGHFAAGIFKGAESIVHKTFHCYTVRAKQGGSQSSRDNRGGSHPKSAGASLRRYNEQSLVQHVQEIISAWQNLLESCKLIFYRAIGPSNSSVLFGGKTPPFKKNDNRLRSIPFSTRRATHSEVKRVHNTLAFVEVHDPEDFQSEILSSYAQKPTAKKEKTNSDPFLENDSNAKSSPRRGRSHGKSSHNRAKSRPLTDRLVPIDMSPESEDDSGDELELSFQSVQIDLDETLKEFDSSIDFSGSPCKHETKIKSKLKAEANTSVSRKADSKTEEEKVENTNVVKEEIKSKNALKKDKKAAAAALRKLQEEEEASKDPVIVLQRALGAALQSGAMTDLQACLSSEFLKSLPASLPGGLKQALNLPLSGGNTALHIASKNGLNGFIRELMLAGADPSVKNKKSQSPYVVAASKETKTVFTDFMVNHPDMYNYSDSQICPPLSEAQEKEKAERKAALMKAKRAREKEKRRTQAEEKAEKEEKDRFLALSDREKRALAAEKRMLAAQKRGTPDEAPLVLARCFTCASDITGKIPFEYENNRFCTFECLKAHRMQVKNLFR